MMEDFSGLALPPLFGGHILEAELEPGGVELGPGEVRIYQMPFKNTLLTNYGLVCRVACLIIMTHSSCLT